MRDPLGTVVRVTILERLRDAAKLVNRGLPDGPEAFRALLADAQDRAEAWSLSRSAKGREYAGRIASAVLSNGSGEPVTEFLLIPFGQVRLERPSAGGDFVFNREHAEAAVRWFQALQRKLAIDYEHQTYDRFNTRPDGLRPAAGWIGGLEVRDDGLWATQVKWTARALNLLRAGEYRYFSPVIFWTGDDCSELVGLGPVALTNDPAMHGVQALAAKNDPEGAPTPASDVARDATAALQAARDEISLLRRELRAQEADAFIERGLRLGKIIDSTSMDWRDDYLRNAEVAEARLARSPVILPPGRIVTPSAISRSAHPQVNEQLQQWGIDERDLEAYASAVAAGRVRRGNAE